MPYPYIDPTQDDFFQKMRMMQLFGGATNPTFQGSYNPAGSVDMAQQSPVAPPTDDNSDDYDVTSRMAALYHPESTAIDKFNTMTDNYPTYKEPGKLRKIGAVIAASLADSPFGRGGGQKVFDAVTGKQDYDEKIADWKNQITPLEQAANIERQDNSNSRSTAYNVISNEIRDRQNKRTADINQQKVDISQQRANAYDFKARNPGMKFLFPKGGNIQVANPQTGEVHDLGIPTGSLTDADKMALQQDDTMAQINARGQNSKDVEGMREGAALDKQTNASWQIYNVPDGQGGQKAVKINAITGDVRDLDTPVGPVNKPGTGVTGSKPDLPTQTRVRQFNAARELSNTRPDLRPFIKLGGPGTNDFTITPPSKNMFGSDRGPSAEQYSDIQKAIYGQPITSHSAPPTNTPPTNNAGAKPKSITREQAIAALKAHNIPPTEDNIKKAMDPNNWRSK